MKTMLVKIAFLFLCSFPLSGQIQSNIGNLQEKETDSLQVLSAPVGTYQVLIPRKPALALNEEFMVSVRIKAEAARKQSEDVLLSLNEHIYLRVPSKDSILSPDFFQLEEIEFY